jgi:Tfp pilus assembly protein PilF
VLGTDVSMTPNRREDLQLRLATALWKDGLEHQLDGKIPEAIKLYLASLALRETPEAHTFLGWTYSFQGQLNEAIAECRKAIEVDPEFGNAYNDMGAYLVELGREEEAMAWFAQAKRAGRYENPQFPYLNLARIHRNNGDLGAALMELQIAELLAPEDERVQQQITQVGALLDAQLDRSAA